MDKQTFTAYVLDAEQTLYRVAKSMLRNDSDCEDAVQEAILKSYQHLDSLRQEQYFKTWLVRILIHECHRLYRAARPTVPYEEACAEAPVQDSSNTALYAAISVLPEPLRLCVVLHYLEGYSLQEVRDTLHIPVGTVKSRLHKARGLLKLQLESE